MNHLPHTVIGLSSYSKEEQKLLATQLPVSINGRVCHQTSDVTVWEYSSNVSMEKPSGFFTKQELNDMDTHTPHYIEFETRNNSREIPIWIQWQNNDIYGYYRYDKETREFVSQFATDIWIDGVLDFGNRVGWINEYGDEEHNWNTDVMLGGDHHSPLQRHYSLTTTEPLELVEVLPYKTGLTVQTTTHLYVLYTSGVQKSFTTKYMTQQQKREYKVK